MLPMASHSTPAVVIRSLSLVSQMPLTMKLLGAAFWTWKIQNSTGS